MKKLLGVVVATCAAIASAHADPIDSTPSSPPSHELGDNYLGGGVAVGAQLDTISALVVEGGHRLVGPLWLHGVAMAAAEGKNNVPGISGDPTGSDGNTYIARAGLEARTSFGFTDNVVGVFAGIDGGVSYIDEMSRQVQSTSAVLVPRVGAEIGSGRLRFRPALEVGFGADRDHDTFLLSGTIVYGW